MTKIIILFMISFVTFSAWSQSWIKIKYDRGVDTQVQEVEGLLRNPEGTPNGQALLILHHGGGFGFNTTKQYGEYYSKRGFVTLELRMFYDNNNRPDPIALHGQVMGALRHLSQFPGIHPGKISAMGMSLGAFLTINASSNWFYNHYRAGDLRFHKLIALYPVCWFMSEANRGQTQGIWIFTGLPPTFLQQSAGIPMLILAAGKDSYDGLDPNACPNFVKNIPDSRQAAITQSVIYPNATHGWDHGRSYNFPVWGQCIGRTNCTNRIVFNPEVVEAGKQAILSFLSGD